MRSNCILFAWRLYWRRRAKGREGYLLLRRSRSGPFPHCLYAEFRRCGTLRVVSFKPLSARDRWLPPPLFKGASRWGDFADTAVEP
ncbi:hypothetical protein DBR42_29480 [Pelomonas sp. HMWF004]|nr:hypothetical protein DBR42_29480 [Pelomonas sp. HMWF004]